MQVNFLKQKKVGFLGLGNMSQAIVKALIDSNVVEAKNIFASNRSDKKLSRVVESLGIVGLPTNEQLVEQSDIVFLGTKPQDLFLAIEPIAMTFHERHIVLSLAAGISLAALKKVLQQVPNLVRVMPNSPARIRRAVVGYCMTAKAKEVENLVRDLLSPMGYVVATTEGEEFEALTVSCASGTGFVFELMQYWQDWIEDYGYDPETARKMTVETFLGAALLAQESSNVELVELQNQVASKKGVTWAGLESMREFEVERLLRFSFEKAILRDRELGKS